MTTTIRPKVSENNKYWIEKHRYYELKHFCLQYPIWKKAYMSLDGLSKRPSDLAIFSSTKICSDPTAKCALSKEFYSVRIDMINRIAIQTDSELSDYILKGVTEGWSYNSLKTRFDIPCSKDTYYERYRKFFWLLNKERQ